MATYNAIVPTAANGIYVTNNLFDTPPTWETANTGLPATDVRQFQADTILGNELDHWVCILEASRNVYLWNGTTWAEILTPAEAQAITGYPAFTLMWVTLDPNNADHIWVLGASIEVAGLMALLKSTDNGVNWAQVTVWDAMGFSIVRNVYNVIVRGQTIAVTNSSGAAVTHYISYSTDGGATFPFTGAVGDSAWNMWVQASPLDDDLYYYNADPGGLSPEDLWRLEASTGITTRLQDALDLGDEQQPQSMWFSASTFDTQRKVVKGVANSKLYATTDGWATVINNAPGDLVPDGAASLADYPDDEDRTIVGRNTSLDAINPHHIMYLPTVNDTALVGLSGAMPDSAPFTDSIPYTAGGVVAGMIAFGVGDPPTNVTITPDAGNSGLICEEQTFTVTVSAGDPPLTYTWSTDGLVSGQGTDTATYLWVETCPDKTVTVTVTNAFGSDSDSYTIELLFTYMQICTAIKDTLESNMSADLLTRAYNYDQLPEGIQDYPSLQVYWAETSTVDALGDTDRFTFGGEGVTVVVKDIIFNVDYVPAPANHLDENYAVLTQAASEMHDIFETGALLCAADKANCPPFGLCGLKSFQWRLAFVTFEFGAVLFRGVRAVITTRVY